MPENEPPIVSSILCLVQATSKLRQHVFYCYIDFHLAVCTVVILFYYINTHCAVFLNAHTFSFLIARLVGLTPRRSGHSANGVQEVGYSVQHRLCVSYLHCGVGVAAPTCRCLSSLSCFAALLAAMGTVCRERS